MVQIYLGGFISFPEYIELHCLFLKVLVLVSLSSLSKKKNEKKKKEKEKIKIKKKKKKKKKKKTFIDSFTRRVQSRLFRPAPTEIYNNILSKIICDVMSVFLCQARENRGLYI